MIPPRLDGGSQDDRSSFPREPGKARCHFIDDLVAAAPPPNRGWQVRAAIRIDIRLKIADSLNPTMADRSICMMRFTFVRFAERSSFRGATEWLPSHARGDDAPFESLSQV